MFVATKIRSIYHWIILQFQSILYINKLLLLLLEFSGINLSFRRHRRIGTRHDSRLELVFATGKEQLRYAQARSKGAGMIVGHRVWHGGGSCCCTGDVSHFMSPLSSTQISDLLDNDGDDTPSIIDLSEMAWSQCHTIFDYHGILHSPLLPMIRNVAFKETNDYCQRVDVTSPAALLESKP